MPLQRGELVEGQEQSLVRVCQRPLILIPAADLERFLVGLLFFTPAKPGKSCGGRFAGRKENQAAALVDELPERGGGVALRQWRLPDDQRDVAQV